MKPRPYLLSELTWKQARDTDYEVVVLPWGATEAHNYHLPYATDNIQCEHVCHEAAKSAWEEGAKVVVLPTIPYGVQMAQRDVKLTINMNPSTQLMVLKDIIDSLVAQGLRKLVIINGHGGNYFGQFIRELYQPDDICIVTLDWYRVVNAEDFFDAPGDHAGEMETSTLLHIAPHLVRPLESAGKGIARTFNLTALKERWAWTQRGWLGTVTQDTGVGDPTPATAEKGRAYLHATQEKVAQLLVEFAALDLNDPYVD